MAPLAGKPPFATDERDSYYEPPRQTRRPRQPPQDPTRTSAYDVYDSYFGDDTTTNRQSGMGAVGLGFMNGSFDDDDDDGDEDDFGRRNSMQKSKHDMLAEATRTRNRTPSPPPVYNVTQPIAQPRPGYAAPIAALDKLAKPEPVASPDSRNPGMRINVSPRSPIQSSPSPHSVAPPLSPIQPAFARPRPAPQQTLAFDEKAIMRGESEGDVIPRRGERGDDFWRRFSMVVRENNLKNPKSKESAWLRKTQNGSNRLATWVWIVGVVLILAVAGGIGLGVYTSQKNTSHATPHAFGGSEGEKSGVGISSTMPVVGKGTPTAHTSFHVSPTKTVARREALFATMAAHRRSPRNH